MSVADQRCCQPDLVFKPSIYVPELPIEKLNLVLPEAMTNKEMSKVFPFDL